MSREPPRYLSYLLRLWQARSEGRLVWRASLESPQTGDRTGFLSLDDLLAFLEMQTGPAAETEEIGPETAQQSERGRDTSCASSPSRSTD